MHLVHRFGVFLFFDRGYIWLFLGNLITGAGVPFYLTCPPKLAEQWFGEKERSTSTALGTLAEQIGILSGFVLTPFVVTSDNSSINSMLIITAAFCCVSSLLAIIFFQEKPPTPPSKAAATKKKNIMKSAKSLAKMPHFWVLFIAFSITSGISYCLNPLLNEIMHPIGYTDTQIAVVGGGILAGGIVGMFGIGFILDKTRSYKLVLNVAFLFTTFLLFWLAYSLRYAQNDVMNILLCATLVGLFLAGTLPACLELCVECTFPCGEGTSTGVLMLGGETLAAIESLIAGYLETNYRSSVWFFAVMTLFASLLFMVAFKGHYLRLEDEVAESSKQISRSNSIVQFNII